MNQNITQPDILSLFHPLVGRWFRERYGGPTDIQRKAWPHIARGNHILATAPTGSGKTQTAFLWAINTLLTVRDPSVPRRVLYISPLKALNNDIRRNLQEPLDGLREYFVSAGEQFPDITVSVRSGDTDTEERRAMLRHPPDIFITTPESLNILISSKSGRRLLTGISTVILDEIHAVAPVKRGTYLMTAVERLVPISGEFQRIALSATVRPPETIADFIGGYGTGDEAGEYTYRKRRVEIISSTARKQYEIQVDFPDPSIDPDNESDWWLAVTDGLRDVIDAERSTLVFANSRRMVEKITRLVNEREGENLVYSHHGSLSKEIREVVEKRLKNGELAAIVATSSLELGIDIGSVDRVVLVQTPYTVASAVQRIGRSGHSVGQVSRGAFYPVNTKDLMEAAVLAESVGSEDIEDIHPVGKPLDVLAQVILSMTLLEERNADVLFGEIRASYSFHDLTREEFDLVVEMLAGRYADTRIRELRPRILYDRIGNTIKARDNVRPLLYLSGGVIPDRGYYNLRVADTKAKIGELDEEFVWERSLGDSFPFGNQIWRIIRVTHNDVEVELVSKSNSVTPFWRAEDLNRSFHLSKKIGRFLEEADSSLSSKEYRTRLIESYHLTESAADSLIAWLERQKEATGVLPNRHVLLVEHFRDPVNVSDTKQTVLHTLWGGAVNRPFALALSAAWEEKYGYQLEIFVNNDCIMLNLPHDFTADDILALADPADITRLLRTKLESTGYFGARFRENAQRALLLPRRSFRDRMPLWLNRLRSKKLLEAVSRFEDFPVLLETWRECMNREFDLETLYSLLEEIRSGGIAVVECRTTAPSPLASNIIWRQTNYYMYEDDTPASKLKTNLSDSLLKEIVFATHLRPRLSNDLIRAFGEKVRRTAPGYPPDSPDELLQFLRERLYITAGEWRELIDAIERDHGIDKSSIIDPIADRIYTIDRDAKPHAIIALENLPSVSVALGIAPDDAAQVKTRMRSAADTDEEMALTDFLGRWLAFYGPVTFDFVRATLGIDSDTLAGAIETLIEDRTVIVDEFREPEAAVGEEICDAENLEILLRMRRAMERPSFEPLPVDNLPHFLASWQGLCPPGEDSGDLEELLERLFGYPSRAALWETDILPARIEPYYTEWLDTAMRRSDLVWFGCGKERIGFAFEADMELFPPDGNTEPKEEEPDASETVSALERFFAGTVGKTGFDAILGAVKGTADSVADALWELAWRGKITNDDYEAVRRGIMNRFRADKPLEQRSSRRRRAGFSRWKNTRPFAGNWYPLDREENADLDAIEEQEIERDRIRQLFMRYGIIFRELTANELPELQWGKLFRTLRLMELSGEIFTGYFFRDIPGLQFCSHAAMRVLNRPLPENSVYWMNACDPASLCGIGIESFKGVLPPRIPSNHLVFHDHTLVLVSKRNGGELTFTVPTDHVRIPDYLGFFKTLLSRRFQPLKAIETVTINSEPALDSQYRKTLTDFGFVKEYKSLVLRKRY